MHPVFWVTENWALCHGNGITHLSLADTKAAEWLCIAFATQRSALHSEVESKPSQPRKVESSSRGVVSLSSQSLAGRCLIWLTQKPQGELWQERCTWWCISFNHCICLRGLLGASFHSSSSCVTHILSGKGGSSTHSSVQGHDQGIQALPS